MGYGLKFLCQQCIACSKFALNCKFSAHQCTDGTHGAPTMHSTRPPRVRSELLQTRCVRVVHNAKQLHTHCSPLYMHISIVCAPALYIVSALTRSLCTYSVNCRCIKRSRLHVHCTLYTCMYIPYMPI